jgi:hypothetical protein
VPPQRLYHIQQIVPTFPPKIYCYPCVVHKPTPSTTNSHGYMHPYLSPPLESMSCYPIQIGVVTTPTSEKGSWANINGEVRFLPGCGMLSSNPLTQTFSHIPCLPICRCSLIMALVTRVGHCSPSPAFLLPAYLSSVLWTPRHPSRPCACCLPRVFQMDIFRITLIHSHALIRHPTSRWL